MTTDREPKTRTPGTYADIEALPPGWVGEILDGTFYGHPRPATGHSHVETTLSTLLQPPFQFGRGGPGGWLILIEPELHFGTDVMVPDLAAWRRERFPRMPSVDTPWLSLPPDWVCEILSPSTEQLDRRRKMPRYASVGVEWAWLIDPRRQSLEVLERDGGRWRALATHSGRADIQAQPFDAVPLEMGLLWLEAE